LLLCGAREQPSRLLMQSAFLKSVGPENVLPHVQAALARAREVMEDISGPGQETASDLDRQPLST
ncbi:MAG: sodium-independent anion transporter, partial [Acidobacteriaceae bacterium]|nr:sodium-independent anion transporter [Acidobacteriaceae bacterium]